MKVLYIIEPLCYGGEHAALNAGLIATARLVFPHTEIRFWAEKEHGLSVRRILENNAVPGISVEKIAAIPHGFTGFKALKPAWTLCKYIFLLARKNNCTTIIFSAIDEASLISIKILIRFKSNIKNVLVIPHSVLQRIQHRPPKKPWNHLIWFRNVLRFYNDHKIKIVVPGESIRKVLANDLPMIAPYLHSLELAYFFPGKQNIPHHLNERTIRFGLLGVATRRKGIETFFSLAEQVARNNTMSQLTPEFWILGPIPEERMRAKMPNVIKAPVADRFVTSEEMAKLIEPMHFAVFPYQAKEYQLVASAAFLDALAYVKPVIALRNPYIEYYFEKMGNIGYLCDSEKEIIEVILNILTKNTAVYHTNCKNIIEGRKIFMPEHLKMKLIGIIRDF